MATSVIHVKNVSLSDITYGTPRSLDSGGKSIPIFHKGNPLVIQTEEMRIPFGIRDAIAQAAAVVAGDDGSSSSVGKKNIEFSVEKDLAPAFFETISSMDAMVIDHAMKHSKQWFRKAHDKRDVLEALYTPMIKYARDKDTGEITDRYAPLFKANLAMKQGVIATEVYDSSRSKIDILSVDLRGARGVAILQCSGVWVAGGKFGCSWRVLQMRVSLSKTRIQGYAFLEDPSDEQNSSTNNNNVTTENDAEKDSAAVASVDAMKFM